MYVNRQLKLWCHSHRNFLKSQCKMSYCQSVSSYLLRHWPFVGLFPPLLSHSILVTIGHLLPFSSGVCRSLQLVGYWQESLSSQWELESSKFLSCFLALPEPSQASSSCCSRS